MEITSVEKEGGAVLLKVLVGENDYGEAVEKELRSYRQKANMPGFRPGMVPMGIIRKMYSKSVTAEQSYRTASKAAFDYLETNKIDFVGDVIPAEEQGAFDFDNNTEHEFIFEYGTAPKFNLELNENDHVTRYAIEIDQKMRDSFRDSFLQRFGSMKDVEEVVKDEALKATLDNGELKVEDAYVGLISMSDDERKPFIGKKVGDKMDVDVNEIYKNPAQRASILGITEDELKNINPKFSLEITGIRKFALPEVDETLLKTAFPDESVKTLDEFEAYIDSQIRKDADAESDNLLRLAIRKYVMAKADLKMPEEFLKRWLFVINENKFSMEDIEKDFSTFLELFTWNFIKSKLKKENNITVSAEEVKEETKNTLREQYKQYGLSFAENDNSDYMLKFLEEMTTKTLENKEQREKMYNNVYDKKFIEVLKNKIDVKTQAISVEEFSKKVQEVVK